MFKANHLLTPGSFDPNATGTIVCAPGYPKSRRPSIWQALKLKAQAMRLYGLALTPHNWHAYTLDHLLPLELGGQPLDIQNVWPQRKTEAKHKDQLENKLRREVCGGLISLAAAQQLMIATWRD